MNLDNVTRIIDGKRYRTEAATVLASDLYWDGHNWERSGHNIWLLRTPKGQYFQQSQSQWQGETTTIEPLTTEEALELYQALRVHDVEAEEAFPGREFPDA